MCYRIAVSTIMVVLLLASPIQANPEDTAQVPVALVIEPYAEIEILEGTTQFGEALGAPGIYLNDGSTFLSRLMYRWGDDWDVYELGDGPGEDLAKVIVTANCDVDVMFSYDEANSDWLTSESIFGVWHRWGNQGYHNSFFGTAAGEDPSVTISQPYEGASGRPVGSQQYELVGGFLIQSINQQEAGSYTAQISVTVSQPSSGR